MRDEIATALKQATKDQDKRRVGTLRLVNAAIKDRDIANRTAGKEAASDDELRQLLAKMIKQREESAKIYAENNRAELAEAEREEIAIIKTFLPSQMDEAEMAAAVAEAVAATGAKAMSDMGTVMAFLKTKHAGRMDFGKANGLVKSALTAG
ncbi:aspartyl-tRNA amidotransferase subunit B [Aureimonas endophytica]|uniref:Aspartyl-tRNA amidotransferase subunit B n=1 Tax=Aureimonas endophytica TaxID=2027858 RepID=A0A916ZEQ8_9HYPH|nr:GatB/YqeY domain-containing protein [Aureimonas endophytica]GGD92973.1 aspartyl-tRNA amidotransferase subunit B [Aureimonas endophytica]